MPNNAAKKDEMIISRRWGTYLIKALLSEEKSIENSEPWPNISPIEIETYKNNLASNFETHIYLLPNPILVNFEEVSDILVFKKENKTIRIYPPFPVNEKAETAGAFKDVNIPEGGTKLEKHAPLPTHAVLGLRVEPGDQNRIKWCRAFRLDVERGADSLPVLQRLIDHICQYTHQWWLRARHNPMLGPARLGGMIRKDFSIAPELKYAGAGEIESTWYGIAQHQEYLGFGSPLTSGAWIQSYTQTTNWKRADHALLTFYDGMAEYMAGYDDKAILNLCIAMEIMLGKHFLVTFKREAPKIEKALRKTQLVDEKTRSILSKLITDRNSVAHGREPYIVSQQKELTVEDYIRAVSVLVSGYLKAMPSGSWADAMDMTLHTQAFSRQGKA